MNNLVIVLFLVWNRATLVFVLVLVLVLGDLIEPWIFGRSGTMFLFRCFVL